MMSPPVSSPSSDPMNDGAGDGETSVSAMGPKTENEGAQHAGPAGLSERDKMIRGLPYLGMKDQTLIDDRQRIRPLMQQYNTFPWPSPPDPYYGPDERQAILAKIFGIPLEVIKNAPIEIEPPFYGDYGYNITFEGSFYANMDLIILDAAPVKFGSRIMCGPRVGIYAATHSSDVDERQGGYERAYPIEIGDDCWIGGGAIVNGPCVIGKGCTIAAGAVVSHFALRCTRDVPGLLRGGVPAKILKKLDPPKGVHDLSKYR